MRLAALTPVPAGPHRSVRVGSHASNAAIASTQVAVSRFWALTDSAMAYRLPVPAEAQQLVLEYVSCVKWSASTWAAWQAKEAHANGGTPSSLELKEEFIENVGPQYYEMWHSYPPMKPAWWSPVACHLGWAGPVLDDREAVCKWATSFLVRLQDLDAVWPRHVEEMWFQCEPCCE